MSIKTTLAHALSKAKFVTVANKPKITLVVGLAATVGAVVAASIATKKSAEEIQSARFDIEDLESDGIAEFYEHQNAMREAKGLEPVEYDIDRTDIEKEKKRIKRETALKVGKNYILAVALLVVAEGCQISTYRELNTRLVKTTALCVAGEAARRELKQAFDNYREKVVEKYGEEADREICNDILNEKKIEKIVDPETGEEQEIEVNQEKHVPWFSIYSREYVNQSYQPGLDVESVRNIQNWANDLLISRGYVFLNEVYEALKLPINGDFVGVGWISREYAKSGYIGDGYIDFGVFGKELKNLNPGALAWKNGETNTVRLDFNVDGPIHMYVNAINKLAEADKDLWYADRAAFYRGKPERYHV